MRPQRMSGQVLSGSCGCRTGMGFDSHGFSTKGTLVLGGKKFQGIPALKGHSDGDALFHAVIDALLGAACLGDIGDLFPDSSARYKGIASGVLLKKALTRVRAAGFSPVHVDITVIGEKPRLSTTKENLIRHLAKLLSLPARSVSIKAKTPEALLWFPPSGGIAVWAMATVQSKN